VLPSAVAAVPWAPFPSRPTPDAELVLIYDYGPAGEPGNRARAPPAAG